MDTNRFRWKTSFSIRKRLNKIPLMLDEGVESHSDGVHRIHWTRIDSDGKDLGGEILGKLLNSRITGSDWLIGT